MSNVSMNNELCRILSRLEGQMKTLHGAFHDFKESLDEIKSRVQHLERQHYLWRGGVTTVLAVGTLIGSACEFLLRMWLMD